jgi:hypothetical protein
LMKIFVIARAADTWKHDWRDFTLNIEAFFLLINLNSTSLWAK